MFFASISDIQLMRQMVQNPLMPDFFGPVMTRAAIEQRLADASPERMARIGRTLECCAVLVVIPFLFCVVAGVALLAALGYWSSANHLNMGLLFMLWCASLVLFLRCNRIGNELERAMKQLTDERNSLQPISLADCSHMHDFCQATPEGVLFRFCVLEEERSFTKGELAMMADWVGAIEQRQAYKALYAG